MYKIKQIPEDFVVEEISKVAKNENGKYAYFELEKRDYSTQYALQILSDKLNIPLKKFGFAGNKDKKAVTKQIISVFYGSKKMEGFVFEGIKLRYLGNGNKPVSLGALEGNKFEIMIRNLSNNEVEKIKKVHDNFLVPNYFGNQRFSLMNHFIGKAIIKKDFEKAVNLILQSDKGNKNIIDEHISKNKNDFVGALRLIPLKTRLLYVHAYQSLLFNKALFLYIKGSNKDSNISLPIFGFGSDTLKINNKQLKKIIENEKINPRDFIISQIPEMSSEGTERKAFVEVKDFKIIEITDDELNKDKKKAKIGFSLEKGSYATVVIDYLLEESKNILNDFI